MSFADDWKAELTRGVELAMRDTYMEAVRRSSGPYSQEELDAMDNPYATRHPSPLLDPSIINEQRGVFRSAWDLGQVFEVDGAIMCELRNDSDVADILAAGTPTMVPRPIGSALEAYAAEEVERRVGERLRALEKQTYVI